MRENGLDPKKYCVIHSDEDVIVLRNYKTRDDATIRKRDRARSEWEERIMRENGLDPKVYCVIQSKEDEIVLRNSQTYDDITIHKGDRAW